MNKPLRLIPPPLFSMSALRIMMKRSNTTTMIAFLGCLASSASLAVPPSAPQNLCIEHTEGIECASTGATSSSETANTNIAAPKSVDPNNFHPGHYLYVAKAPQRRAQPSASSLILLEFVGGQRAYS